MLGYRAPNPSSIGRVRIGDSLKAAWGRSLQMVPEPLGEGENARMPPIKPSGIEQNMVNQALQFVLARTAAMGLTSFYDGFTTADPEDERYALIYRFVQQGGLAGGAKDPYVPGIGRVFLDDGFWAYAKRKMDQQQESDYKLWKIRQIDLAEPALRDWWIARTPEFIPMMMAGKAHTQAILNRAADIRIKGVQSEEDLRFLWEVEVGAYELPGVPKSMPPKEFIEAQQFPGLTTPMDSRFPGVYGPAQNAQDRGIGMGPSSVANLLTRPDRHTGRVLPSKN